MDRLLRQLSGSFFPSPAHYGITCAVFALAEAVYVLFGFGVGMIAVGALAMVLPRLQDVVVLLLVGNLPVEVWVAWRGRHEIDWRGVALICLSVAVGVPAGSVLLRLGDPSFVLATLGLLLIGIGAAFLLLPQHAAVDWPRWVAPLAGLLAGGLSGLFGTGGPPLILYFRLAGLDKASFRGNLMAVFLLMTLVRIPSYAVIGLLTWPRAGAALMVLPAVLLGALAGDRVHLRLSEATFRRMVAIALAAIGLLLLTRGTR